ncbi:MAG: hypothetical protein ACKO4L_16395, partial [Nodosilinea sp.]
LLRANQAETQKLTALTQSLVWQLQGEESEESTEALISDQPSLLGDSDREIDQAETQGEYDQGQALFLPPSPVDLPPLIIPIAMAPALAASPEDLEVFEFTLPQVSNQPPLAVVQGQPGQAYRFMETLTDWVGLEMIAIPGGQLDLARSEEASALDDSHGSGDLPSTVAVEDFFM